jgi:surface protein
MTFAPTTKESLNAQIILFIAGTSPYPDINSWDVSNIKNMDRLFQNQPTFNSNISKWNVGNVTSMAGMFEGATLYNQPFTYMLPEPMSRQTGWYVRNVNNMNSMFKDSGFNQPLNQWDVGNVLNMSKMFENTSFNQPLNLWDVSRVEEMARMFKNNRVFNQPIGNWTLKNRTVFMFNMFAGATNFNNDLSHWRIITDTDIFEPLGQDMQIEARNRPTIISEEEAEAEYSDDEDDDIPVVPTHVPTHVPRPELISDIIREYIEINAEWHRQIDTIWRNAPDLDYNSDTYEIIIPLNVPHDVSDQIYDIYVRIIRPLIQHFNQSPKYIQRCTSKPMTTLQRQTSLNTDQGNEDTCFAHSESKLYLQNIFMFVNPIQDIDVSLFKKCSALRTDELTTISLQKCGNGYYKILLFLYLYFLIIQNKGNRHTLLPTILQMTNVPAVFSFQNHIDFSELCANIIVNIRKQELTWIFFTVRVTPETIPFLKNIIDIILNLNLYIKIGILNHTVTLIGKSDDYYNYVNSYGLNDVYNTTNFMSIVSDGGTYVPWEFTFVLPLYKDTLPLQNPRPTIDLISFINKKDITYLVSWIYKYNENILHHYLIEGKLTKIKTTQPLPLTPNYDPLIKIKTDGGRKTHKHKSKPRVHKKWLSTSKITIYKKVKTRKRYTK